MRKFNSKIKNFFERRNLSKLTALGLSLALSATIGGHAFSQDASGENGEIVNNAESLSRNIQADLTVIDTTPQYNIRIDWESMNFTATITNNNTPTHGITWSGGGDHNRSKFWIQNGSSCPLNTTINYAESTQNYYNVHGTLNQENSENWVTIAANSERSTNAAAATASMSLGTMSEGYQIANPTVNNQNYGNDIAPTLNNYHQFRGVFSLELRESLTDVTGNNDSKPARIVGNYDVGQRYLAGTTTITFSKREQQQQQQP